LDRRGLEEIVGGAGITPQALKAYSHVEAFVEPNTEFVGAASRGCASQAGAQPNGPAGLFQLTKEQFDVFRIDGLPDNRLDFVSNIFAAVNMQFHCRVKSGKPLDKDDARTLPLHVDIAGFRNPYGPKTVPVVAPSTSASTPAKPVVSTPVHATVAPTKPPSTPPAAAAA